MIYLLLTILLVLSFALSGLESAILAVSRVRVRHAADAGDRRAAGILVLVEDRDALLGAITVANHIANLCAFIILTWKIIHVSDAWGYLFSFLIALPIFLIGLEILPKKLFRRYPFRAIRSLAPLLHGVGILRPLFRLTVRPAAVSPGIVHNQGEDSKGREDIREQANALQRMGMMAPGAARLVECALAYRRRRAADLMRPLNTTVALAPDMPLATAMIFARERRAAALPVIGEKGAFIGIIDLASLPSHLPADRLVRQHMRSLDSVSASDSAMQALQHLRKRGRSLCLVMGTDGNPAGILHEEDLLRGLLGADVASVDA
jgi:CBS domain containing-hemolysin-like protein